MADKAFGLWTGSGFGVGPGITLHVKMCNILSMNKRGVMLNADVPSDLAWWYLVELRIFW